MPPGPLFNVVVAEDDDDDFLLIGKALKEAGSIRQVFRVKDGEELMDYLLRRGRYADSAASPSPSLIFLDLNMPKKDGREALEEIKAHPGLRRIPIIILTTSNSEKDILRSYELGAAGFIVKPDNFSRWAESMKTLDRYWFHVAALPSEA